MKNKDKYREQIIEILMTGKHFAVATDCKIDSCGEICCKDCIFTNKESCCADERKKWLNQEVEILDEAEKKYLSAVIKPFRNQVINISKQTDMSGLYAFVRMRIKEDNPLVFPYFNINSMYQGMEVNKEYTLEDLGL